MAESDTGYELVMPFVACQSKGGPYDDEAYVAGYEMGLLDKRLEDSQMGWRLTIHEPNRAQADLIAMRHGYVMTVVGEYEEWLDVEFVKSDA